MKIQFLGAARTVTGSKHLITTKTTTILLDCGFFQGRGADTDTLNRHLGFDPASIDFLILSHAHIDHSGNIPYLVKQGFKGRIIATPATVDLCKIMLKDSAHIQENDLKHLNERRVKRGEEELKPIYSVEDVDIALKLFEDVPYQHTIDLDDYSKLLFTDAGHILGSAAVNLTLKEDKDIQKICFTGDIGRYGGSILKDPQNFPQCDVLITESTYGDRLHSDSSLSEEQLYQTIYRTCVVKKGKLIIPAFSLGRTQELVYALDKMATEKQLPPIQIFVDSPLSINATDVMRAHPECFNDDILKYMKNDPDPFGFEKLIYIQDVELSKKLNAIKGPCIIISASGMMEAGRIKHHVANTISDPKNTILIVGYAEPTSLGGRIRNGAERVKIFGDQYPVKAEIVIMDSYSAHADYAEMLKYFTCQDISKIKHTFIVHGEYETQLNFKDKLNKVGFRNIEIPAAGDVFEI